MVQNVNPTFVKTPNNGLVQISTATGTAAVTVYTGGANGSKIVGLLATSQSSGTVNVRVAIVNGGTSYYVTENTVTAGSGFSGATATSNLFGTTTAVGFPIDSDGNPYLLLKSSADTLTAAAESTLVSGVLSIIAITGDF